MDDAVELASIKEAEDDEEDDDTTELKTTINNMQAIATSSKQENKMGPVHIKRVTHSSSVSVLKHPKQRLILVVTCADKGALASCLGYMSKLCTNGVLIDVDSFIGAGFGNFVILQMVHAFLNGMCASWEDMLSKEYVFQECVVKPLRDTSFMRSNQWCPVMCRSALHTLFCNPLDCICCNIGATEHQILRSLLSKQLNWDYDTRIRSSMEGRSYWWNRRDAVPKLFATGSLALNLEDVFPRYANTGRIDPPHAVVFPPAVANSCQAYKDIVVHQQYNLLDVAMAWALPPENDFQGDMRVADIPFRQHVDKDTGECHYYCLSGRRISHTEKETYEHTRNDDDDEEDDDGRTGTQKLLYVKAGTTMWTDPYAFELSKFVHVRFRYGEDCTDPPIGSLVLVDGFTSRPVYWSFPSETRKRFETIRKYIVVVSIAARDNMDVFLYHDTDRTTLPCHFFMDPMMCEQFERCALIGFAMPEHVIRWYDYGRGTEDDECRYSIKSRDNEDEEEEENGNNVAEDELL